MAEARGKEKPFVRPSSVLGTDLDLDYQRRFFRCEGWSDGDLLEWAETLEEYPGGAWLRSMPQDVRMVFAMSCLRLKEENPSAYARLIVGGEAWLSYG